MTPRVLVVLAALALGSVSASAQTESLVFHTDSTVSIVLRRYYTANPPDSLACLYGSLDSTGVQLDSAVIAPRCGPPAFGALGVGYEPDDMTLPPMLAQLCRVLAEHPWLKLVGLVVGISRQPDGHRQPEIVSCWRVEQPVTP